MFIYYHGLQKLIVFDQKHVHIGKFRSCNFALEKLASFGLLTGMALLTCEVHSVATRWYTNTVWCGPESWAGRQVSLKISG